MEPETLNVMYVKATELVLEHFDILLVQIFYSFYSLCNSTLVYSKCVDPGLWVSITLQSLTPWHLISGEKTTLLRGRFSRESAISDGIQRRAM